MGPIVPFGPLVCTAAYQKANKKLKCDISLHFGLFKDSNRCSKRLKPKNHRFHQTAPSSYSTHPQFVHEKNTIGNPKVGMITFAWAQKIQHSRHANSAWFCPISLNTARNSGSSLEGAILCPKMFKKLTFNQIRGIEYSLIGIKLKTRTESWNYLSFS